ncbi:MAG TPA: hypothetical protein PL137_09055, partial [Nocardioides sp.]|nr:hypothetical protein [Nocardioides sp.]
MTLRGRIRLLALGAATAVLVLLAIPVWLLEARSAAHDVEQSAMESAQSVADYLSATGVGVDLEAYVERVNDREDVAPVAVVTPDGRTYGPDLPGASEQTAAAESDGEDEDGDRDGPFLRQSQVDVDAVAGGRLVRVEVRTDGGPTAVLAFAGDDRVDSTLATRLL